MITKVIIYFGLTIKVLDFTLVQILEKSGLINFKLIFHPRKNSRNDLFSEEFIDLFIKNYSFDSLAVFIY